MSSSEDEDQVPATLGAKLKSGVSVRPYLRLNPTNLVALSDTLNIHPRIRSKFIYNQLNLLTANGRFDPEELSTLTKLWHQYQIDIIPAITDFQNKHITFDVLVDFMQNELANTIDYNTRSAIRFVADPTILGHTFLEGVKYSGKFNVGWRNYIDIDSK